MNPDFKKKRRLIVNPNQKGAPNTIVAIVKRSRLTKLMKTLKKKFDSQSNDPN